MTSDHAPWMARALVLAARGAGHVSPNPLVGCVVVGEDGAVLGEGWHARYGGPHAEVHALADAEARHGAEALKHATLYCTLEPCAHVGQTPPCADLIVAKGVPRVVVGMRDPFPKVDGRGIARLRAAGVDVTVGVAEAACRRLNAAFLTRVTTGRPFVVLKLAQTLDGFIATASGESRWITGEAARARVHALRAASDAVLVGAGTARADDPALTARDVPEPARVRQPLRIVLDRAGTLPPTLRLFTDAHAARTVAVVGEGAAPSYAPALDARGGTVLRVPTTADHLDLGALLDALGRGAGLPVAFGGRPVQSLLVEAGPGLASALLSAALVDRLHVFVAPKLLGAGLPSLRLPAAARLADARTFAAATWETVGADALFTGEIRLP